MLTDAQKRLRATGLGGSDMCALSGLSRRWRPIDVFRSKCRTGPELDEDAAEQAVDAQCQKGTFLEPGVRNWYAVRQGCWVEEVGTIVHPEHRLVLATPDGLSHFPKGQRRALEIKCPRFSKWRDWSAGDFPHDLKIPDYYLPQVTWEMAVLGAAQCDVAVLFGDELYVLTVDFDAELYATLRRLAETFWDHCVIPNQPPDPDDSPSYLQHLVAEHPVAKSSELLAASGDVVGLAKQLRQVTDAIAELEAQRRLVRSQIEQFIGDAAGVDLGGGSSITWRNNKQREVIDYDALCAHYKIDQVALGQFKRTKPGPRVFRPNLKSL